MLKRGIVQALRERLENPGNRYTRRVLVLQEQRDFKTLFPICSLRAPKISMLPSESCLQCLKLFSPALFEKGSRKDPSSTRF